MLVISVVVLIIGIILILGSTPTSEPDTQSFFIGLITIGIGTWCAYKAGTGHLSDSLSEGDVREVVCTAPIDGKRYGALLRKPDGELEASFLSKVPPKNFVVTEDAEKYSPYPGK